MSEPNTFSSATLLPESTFHPRFDIGVTTADCGHEPQVERYDAAADAISWPLIDYSDCPPTDDQQAINHWFAHADLDGKQVLHIGIGNSSIARIAAGRATRVTGITVALNELTYGSGLALPGYAVLLMNKYGEEFTTSFEGTSFDYIVDNNLTSFACCQKHMERYVEALAGMLAKDGAIVTHWLGMQWVLDVGVDDVERAWVLDERKLVAIAAPFGLVVDRQGDLFFLRHRERHGSEG